MRRNDQPSRPNAMTCSRFSLLKTWLMTTEGNFPLQQLCLKPSLYGRFSLDHLWPLLGDHRGQYELLFIHQLQGDCLLRKTFAVAQHNVRTAARDALSPEKEKSLPSPSSFQFQTPQGIDTMRHTDDPGSKVPQKAR